MRNARLLVMDVAISSPRPVSKSTKRAKHQQDESSSNQAMAEIVAYAAIRDELLLEAQELKTKAKVDSLTIANDFVQSCLNPARPPYQSQYLPESAAASHRKRCEIVRQRIAELRALAR